MKYEVCLFPGQGSQKIGMGEDLFPMFPEYVEIANAVLGYDIVELCLENKDNRLQQTDYTQPALYVVNALSYLKYKKENGVPNVVLGHSLGEFNALFAAGVYDFATGLKIVQKRGQLMAECEKGGMAAVMGLEIHEIDAIIKEHFPALDIANINSNQQVVISGPIDTIAEAIDVFEEEFATYIPLKVGGAFHSRYMQPVQDVFGEIMDSIESKEPEIDVISNVTARPYESGQFPELILQQITQSVKWYDSIVYLLEKGACNFYELGPGQVLTNLVKKIEKSQLV